MKITAVLRMSLKYVDWSGLFHKSVRNQGSKPICKHHAVTQLIEAAFKVKTGKLIKFSTPQLIKETKGIWATEAVLQYVKWMGLGRLGKNSHRMRRVKIDYQRVIGIQNIVRALEVGPLVGRMWGHYCLGQYRGGILTQQMVDDPNWEILYKLLLRQKKFPICERNQCPRKYMAVSSFCQWCGYWGLGGHAVVIIGFDLRDPLHPHLLIKNSWGKDWGEGGHLRIEITGNWRGGNQLTMLSSMKHAGVLGIEHVAWSVEIR